MDVDTSLNVSSHSRFRSAPPGNNVQGNHNEEAGVAHEQALTSREQLARVAVEGIILALNGLAVRPPEERGAILAATGAALELIGPLVHGGELVPLLLRQAA